MPEPSLVPPLPIGPTHVFHAKYLGSCAVQSSSGIDVVLDALKHVKKKNSKANKRSIPVAAQVNSFMLQLMHESAEKIVHTCKIDEISFYYWDASRKKRYLSYIILSNEGTSTCHFLKFPKTAQPLHQALAIAFIEASDRRKKGGIGASPQSMATTVRNLTQNAVQV